MAPFMPGDFIEYSGIRKGDEIIAYSIVATNVQILTDPARGHPVYLRMEDAIVGVFSPDGDRESAPARVSSPPLASHSPTKFVQTRLC
jgi:hypothetical protein